MANTDTAQVTMDGKIRIATITKVCVHDPDGPTPRAYCYWVDTNGNTGNTNGHPNNTHMQALMARAAREHAAFGCASA